MNAFLQLVEAIELSSGDEPGPSSCPVSKQGHKQPLTQELTNTLLKASASKTASAARWHQAWVEALAQNFIRTEKLGQILSLRGASPPSPDFQANITSFPTAPDQEQHQAEEDLPRVSTQGSLRAANSQTNGSSPSDTHPREGQAAL